MTLIAHRFHSIEDDGPWESPPFPPADRRHIVQGVTAGYLTGHPRWAESLDGTFLYGLDAKGREMTSAPSVRTPTSRHHATRSPAQLNREIAAALARHRSHATMGTPPPASKKIPSFKISMKAPATMTAAEINKELNKLDGQDTTLGNLMIETGRGYERPSEYLKLTDPLSMELRKNSDRRQGLRIEISLRYGPNPPSRLPTGWGFGPRPHD